MGLQGTLRQTKGLEMYHVAMERRGCVWIDGHGGCKSITDAISCVLSWFARIETGEEIVKLSPVELQTTVHMTFVITETALALSHLRHH